MQYPPLGLTGLAAALLTDVVLTLLLGGVCAMIFLRARRYRRMADAMRGSLRGEVARPALQGGIAVLEGTVQSDEDTLEEPILLTLTMRARNETRDGALTHTWTETSRTLAAKPFWLVLAGGERVRVEPGADVTLTDKLEWQSTKGLEREAAVRVQRDERVFIGGELSRGFDSKPARPGYREPGASSDPGWVIRPPRGERLAVLSTDAAPELERHGRALRDCGLVLVALLAVIHVGLLGTYHLTRWFGVVVQARVEGVRVEYRRGGRNRSVPSYTLTASYEASGGSRVPLSAVTFTPPIGASDPVEARGQDTPFRVVPFWPSVHQLGAQAYVPLSPWFALLALLGAVPFYLLGLVARHRPWFLHVRYEQHGAGHVA